MSAMPGLRAQLGWLLRGRAATHASLESLSKDLRDLQLRVDAVDQRLRELHVAHAATRDRQLDEFDRVRDAVAVATDDLVQRVTALSDRLGSPR